MTQPDSALFAAAKRILACYHIGEKEPHQWLGGDECNNALKSLKGVVDALEYRPAKPPEPEARYKWADGSVRPMREPAMSYPGVPEPGETYARATAASGERKELFDAFAKEFIAELWKRFS